MEIFKLFGSVFIENEKANKQIDDTDKKGKGLTNTFDVMGGKLKAVGGIMSAAVTAPIVGGFVAITQGTKELRGDLATLTTNASIAGQSMGVLDEAMVKMYAVTGETDSNVEGLSNMLATGFKDEKLTALVDAMAGASIKFKDTMKFEGMADGLQETLATGKAIGPFAELIDRAGIGVDNFDAGLKKAIESGTQQEYVLETLAKAGLPAVYEEYRKNNEELVKAEEANFRMQQSMAQLGATLEPILTPIISKITQLVGWFNTLDASTQKVVLIIVGLAAAIGPVLIVVGTLIGSVSTIAGVFTSASVAIAAAGGALAILTGPIGIAIAIIAALIAIGVALYKNWDEISAFATLMWNNLKTGWTEGTQALITAWLDLKTQVSTAWNELWAGVTTRYNEIKTALMTVSNEIVTWMTTKFGTFKTGFLEIWSGIVGGVRGYANGIIRLVNGIINALNTIQVEIPEWVPEFGGKSYGINIDNVPYLAEGGNITRRGWTVVGDQGPEMLNLNAGAQVRPLDKTGGITFERGAFEGAFIMDDYGVDRLMDRIFARMGVEGGVV
ncbi:MAG: hypothetical protein M0P69_13540 [Bacteroidales bacterium]|nr:hypothetical protein [Bacteroidales bacterium]